MDKKQYKREYDKKYYKKNKEKVKQNRLKHRDKLLQYQKEYHKTETFKKSHRIEKRSQYNKEWKKNNPLKAKKSQARGNWKRRGLAMDTFEYVWSIYLVEKKCHLCNYQFKELKEKRMDHCHQTHQYRGIMCNYCNWRKIKLMCSVSIQ